MELEATARRMVDRVMLALSLHLALLICTALLSIPSYSLAGIGMLFVRFGLPILVMLLPFSRDKLPPLRPATGDGWWDLLPAWAILLVVGLVVPGGTTQLPDAPLPLLLLQLVVLTPVLEELLFRGIPLALCKHFDRRIVLLLLALLFALLHSGFTKVYALQAGLVLGIGLLLGRGLLFSILLHACNNLLAFLFLLWKELSPATYLTHCLPLYYLVVGFIVASGVVVGFLRAKQGCYKLKKQVFDSEDGAPLPLARLATPLSVLLLIVFALVALLL